MGWARMGRAIWTRPSLPRATRIRRRQHWPNQGCFRNPEMELVRIPDTSRARPWPLQVVRRATKGASAPPTPRAELECQVRSSSGYPLQYPSKKSPQAPTWQPAAARCEKRVCEAGIPIVDQCSPARARQVAAGRHPLQGHESVAMAEGTASLVQFYAREGAGGAGGGVGPLPGLREEPEGKADPWVDCPAPETEVVHRDLRGESEEQTQQRGARAHAGGGV